MYMSSKLLRGSLETIILKLLSEHQELYGYEITQLVEEQTTGGIKLTQGALYPALHKMEAKGTLSVETRSIGNRYRKYYSLTKKGKTEVAKLLNEMEQFLASLQLILNPKTA